MIARLLPRLPSAWLYALRNTVAALTALYIAYYLQLDTPYSAATTVFILASPTHGMVLSKGVYRALGTLAGVIASIVLVAFFAQTPTLFVIGFSLWLGLCTAAATLLRYFRSYGAVLAGYTVALIGFTAVDHPENIFDVAMARLAVVIIGIVVSGVMTVLLIPSDRGGPLRRQMRKTARDLADFAATAIGTRDIAALDQPRRRLAGAISALDPLIEAAGAEAVEIARQVPALRALAARYYEIIMVVTGIQQGLARLDEAARAEISGFIDRIAEALRAEDRPTFRHLREICRAASFQVAEAEGDTDLTMLVLFDRLDELLVKLPDLLATVARLETQPLGAVAATIRFHTDRGLALVNGLRGALAVLATYVFWYETAWSSGPLTFVAVAPICGLLATAPNPAAGSVQFLKGIVIAAVLAFFYTYFVMAEISGFVLLALTMAPFFLVASVLTASPKHGLVATAFLIFFNTFVGARNPMTYDVLGFLNTTYAILVGTIFSVLVFRLFFPTDPYRILRRLGRALRHDLEMLASIPDLTHFAGVQHRMHDRMVRLVTQSGIEPGTHERIVADSRAALRIAYEMGRIRMSLATLRLPPGPARAVDRGMKALAHLREAPEAAASSTDEAARHLAGHFGATPPETRAALARAAGSFEEISILLNRHGAFFKAARQSERRSSAALAG